MRYLVSYDITDDRRRTRLAHLLEDFGTRVQYSVFECDLGEARLLELRRKALMVMDRSTDSLRIYLLCARCREAMEVLGCGRVDAPGRVNVI